MKILIVEDTFFLLKAFLGHLENHTVSTATNVKDAIALINEAEPDFDVISLDYNLPMDPDDSPGPWGNKIAEALVAAGYQGGVTLHSNDRAGVRHMTGTLDAAGIKSIVLNLRYPEYIEDTLREAAGLQNS